MKAGSGGLMLIAGTDVVAGVRAAQLGSWVPVLVEVTCLGSKCKCN